MGNIQAEIICEAWAKETELVVYTGYTYTSFGNIMHLFKIQWNGNKSQSFQTITTPSPIHFSSSSLHPVGIPSKPLNYIQLMHGNFRYENFAFVRLNKSDERESSVRSSVRAPSDGKREKERVCCICSCNIRRPSDASA